MSKFYVVSDVHGFFDEMKKSLDDSGFDPNDSDSWLVSLGDELDRGDQPKEVIDYLKSLPRKILVRGNHDDLIEEMIERGYPLSHDYDNGTYYTVKSLVPNARRFDIACSVAYEIIKPILDEKINYFETENYIFVHSFVPLVCKDSLPKYYIKNRIFEKNIDWRNAGISDWEQARWGNPFILAEEGFLPDKTLVFGHFHTSWARKAYNSEPEFGDEADFSPYYGKGYIGIDACTAYSRKVNVLVLEDDFMCDKNLRT